MEKLQQQKDQGNEKQPWINPTNCVCTRFDSALVEGSVLVSTEAVWKGFCSLVHSCPSLALPNMAAWDASFTSLGINYIVEISSLLQRQLILTKGAIFNVAQLLRRHWKSLTSLLLLAGGREEEWMTLMRTITSRADWRVQSGVLFPFLYRLIALLHLSKYYGLVNVCLPTVLRSQAQLLFGGRDCGLPICLECPSHCRVRVTFFRNEGGLSSPEANISNETW